MNKIVRPQQEIADDECKVTYTTKPVVPPTPDQARIVADLVDPDSEKGVQTEEAEQAKRHPFNSELDAVWVLTHDLDTTATIAPHLSDKLFRDNVCRWAASIAVDYWTKYRDVVPDEVLRRELWAKVDGESAEIKKDTLARYREITKARPAGYTRDQALNWVKGQAARRAMSLAYETAKKGALDLPKLREELAKVESIGATQQTRYAVADASVETLPDPEMLVEGFIDTQSITNLFGDSNVGKSFLALDMANALARCLPFGGHFKVTKALPVAYIYSESPRGLKKRLMVWRKARNAQPSKNVAWIPFRYNLMEPTELDAALKDAEKVLGQPPAVLFIDTLSKNFLGKETNDDFAAVVNNLLDAVTQQGLTVVIVHHTGKDKSQGSRGGYALTCNVENEIVVEKYNDNAVLVTPTKVKDGAKKGAMVFGSKEYTLPDGQHSLVFTFSHMVELAGGEKDGKATQQETQILNALTDQPTTVAALAAATTLSKSIVNKTLERLRRLNKVGFKENMVKGAKTYTYWKPDEGLISELQASIGEAA